MLTIRPAEPSDLDALVAMGKQFFAYSEYAKFAPFDPEATRRHIDSMMAEGTMLTGHTSLVLVADLDGEIVGGLVGAISAMWFNPAARVACELAWWVGSEYRGGTAAVRLYRAFEVWAEEQGVVGIVMSDLVIDGETPAAALFERLGYTTVERAHFKQRSH